MSDVEFLSNSRRRSWKPILDITQHFYPTDTEPCCVTEFQYQTWYHGAGLPPIEHPGYSLLNVLHCDLPLSECGFCASQRVLVIALQGNIHPMSGDAYYDYEIVCQDCRGFTSYSYAEN